jgi:hypothetical protein
MNMDEVETMDRLHKIIIDGVDLSLELVDIGQSSDRLYQATFERYGRVINEVISEVAKVKTKLFNEYREAELAKYMERENQTGGAMICMFYAKSGICTLPHDKHCCSIDGWVRCNSHGKVVCRLQ